MLVVMTACAVVVWTGAIRLFALRRDRRARMLTLALDNMSQGAVMFDAAGRLVVCNARYRDIYGMPPDLVKPGVKLIDIIRNRFQSGNLDRDPAQYCAELMDMMRSGKEISFVSELADGRSISVINRAIPGGGYWLGTHHDITARRAAERNSALLSEQAARRAVLDDAIALVSRLRRKRAQNRQRMRRDDEVDRRRAVGDIKRYRNAHRRRGTDIRRRLRRRRERARPPRTNCRNRSRRSTAKWSTPAR